MWNDTKILEYSKLILNVKCLKYNIYNVELQVFDFKLLNCFIFFVDLRCCGSCEEFNANSL